MLRSPIFWRGLPYQSFRNRIVWSLVENIVSATGLELAPFGIPHLCRAVTTACNNVISVRAERHAAHITGLPLDSEYSIGPWRKA
jgi:hypothetical protein